MAITVTPDAGAVEHRLDAMLTLQERQAIVAAHEAAQAKVRAMMSQDGRALPPPATVPDAGRILLMMSIPMPMMPPHPRCRWPRTRCNVLLLGIETSCDDTATAVVRDGRTVLSNVSTNQDAFHAKFGGIVPEIASRRHVALLSAAVEDALDRAGVALAELDGIAVTAGPGPRRKPRHRRRRGQGARLRAAASRSTP